MCCKGTADGLDDFARRLPAHQQPRETMSRVDDRTPALPLCSSRKTAAKDAGWPSLAHAHRTRNSEADTPIRIYRGSCRNNRS